MYPDGVTLIRPAVERASNDSAVVLEALAREPSAVVYDLANGHRRSEPLSVTFDAIDAYLDRWTGTPLLVHVPDETQAAVLQAHPLARHVTTWPTLADAMAAAHRHRPLERAAVVLDPVLSAPREARSLIDQAFGAWQAKRLVNDAKIVVTEMVTNAVVHARTTVVVSLSHRPGTSAIRVGVHDASDALPVLGPRAGTLASDGRGLWIVGIVAQGWGYVRMRQGKVVWAVLD